MTHSMEPSVLSVEQRWLKKQVGAEWDDLLQDAWLRCQSKIGEEFYDVYFGRAITNGAINFLRHRSSVELVSISDREEKPIDVAGLSYETNFETNYDVRKFMMDRWSATERDVIFMFFTDQISVRGACAMLGKSRTRTHVWLRRVRKQFKKGMA